MAKNISIRKNFIMNTILTMSSFVFPIITFPYVSRVLQPSGNGKVSFAISLISYFSMFAQLGIPTYGVRVCAKVRDKKEELTRTAHELLMINLIMTVITYIALALALLFIPRLQDDRLLYVVVSSTILLTAIGMEWLYKALEQYTYITIRSLIFKLIALIAMFVLVHQKSDYIIYGGITVLASSASYLMNMFNAHKYIGFKPVGGYNLKKHLKPVALFFSMACATTIYNNLDVIMLGFMKTESDVGYYHAAIRIKILLVSIVTSLGTVLLPRASYYIQKRQMDEFHKISKKALNFVFLFAIPLSVYFIIYAKYGVFLLSGDAYQKAILPMQVLMPTLLIIGLSNILGIQILVPLGKERIVLMSEIAGVVTDIIINAILIPPLASTGAAIGTLAAELVVFVYQYFSLKEKMGNLFYGIHYLRILVATCLGAILSIWVIFLPLGNFMILMISAIMFFGTYAFFMYLKKEEMVIDVAGNTLSKIKKVLKKQ